MEHETATRRIRVRSGEMLPFTIGGREIVVAQEFSCWSMSLSGSPKLSVTCGSCLHSWSSRQYHTTTLQGRPHGSTLTCPACAALNFVPIFFE